MVFECSKNPRPTNHSETHRDRCAPSFLRSSHRSSIIFIGSKMGNGASAPKNKVGKRVVREVSLHISIPILVSASGVGVFVCRDIGKPK